MSLYAHLIVIMLLATVLTPLLGTVPLRGWRWDRQCWWLLGLLSIGMPLAAGHRFARILLPGVGAMFSAISLAGLDAMLRAERQGSTAPALWWRRLARAFAAAGFWVMLVLAHVALTVKGNGTGLYSVIMSIHSVWLGSGLTTGIVVALILALDGPDGRSHDEQADAPHVERTVRIRRVLLGGMMLVCLAVGLMRPWTKLHLVGPDVLGYLGFDGFAPDVLLSERDAAKPVLACLAWVTLLLWAFQWLLALTSASGRRAATSLRTPK
jgi:hypothetical protein